MSDIVQRLLAPAYWISGSNEEHKVLHALDTAPVDAAKTIESLRAELAKVNMEVDRLTRTNDAKREHRDKLLQSKIKDAARSAQLEAALRDTCQHIRGGSDISGQFVYFINKYKAVPAINNMFSLWETSAALEKSTSAMN